MKGFSRLLLCTRSWRLCVSKPESPKVAMNQSVRLELNHGLREIESLHDACVFP
jgi:hypothetical protein